MATRIRTRFYGDQSVTTPKIADAAITSDKIADLSISNSKLAGSAVDTTKLADNAVSTSKIIDANVTTDKLADASVTTDKLASGAVTAVKIGDGAVTTAKVANSAITSTELAVDSIVEAKIANGAVTGGKLAANSVSTDKIIDGSVTGAKLAGDSVDGSKIADGAIGAEHISDNSVDGAAIQNGSVSEAHLTAAAQAKLNNSLSRITKDFAPDADCDASNTHASVAQGDWTVGDKAMVGSMWFYIDASDADPANHVFEIYRCVKSDAGAAQWVNTTIDSTELGDLAFMNQTLLEQNINIAIARVSGLQSALNDKANDSEVVKKAGDPQTITSQITTTQAIIAQGGVTGNLTGNVTGQVSDLSNHLGTLAGGEEDKYVDAAELAAKFDELEDSINAAATDFETQTYEATGDGATTSYSFGTDSDVNLLLTVFVGGIRLKSGDDYSLTNAGTVQFAFTPEAGELIAVERMYRLGN